MLDADLEVFPHRAGIETGEVLGGLIVHPNLIVGAKFCENGRYQNSDIVVFRYLACATERRNVIREIHKLLDHGMLDMVVHRHKLRAELARLISYLCPGKQAA